MKLYFDREAYKAKEMVGIKAAILDKLRKDLLQKQRISRKTHEQLVQEHNMLYIFALRQIHFFEMKSPQALQQLVDAIKGDYDRLNKEHTPYRVAREMLAKYPDMVIYDPLLKMFEWGKDLASAATNYALSQEGIEVVRIF